MNDWRARLREADPGRDAAMADADVRRVRATVIAAAHQASRQKVPWSRAFVVAATTLVLICASMLTALQRSVDDAPAVKAGVDESTTAASELDGERQQLHFETPGGTRIIWVFNSKFDLKGTLP